MGRRLDVSLWGILVAAFLIGTVGGDSILRPIGYGVAGLSLGLWVLLLVATRPCDIKFEVRQQLSGIGM